MLLLACVASVSVGLSAGLKHFSLFDVPLAPIFVPRTGGKTYGNACFAGYVAV